MKCFLDVTDSFGGNLDVSAMLADLGRLNGDEWLNHYDASLSSDYVALTLVSIDGREAGPEAQRHVPLSEYGRYKPTSLLAKLPYFAQLLDSFACQKGRVRISKLGPGASIREHRDTRDEAASYAFGQVRLHIPIKTNPHVKFWIDRHAYHMAAGRLYYGDFTKRHFVENGGDEVRIHLVMDLMLNDWLAALFPPLGALDRLGVRAARAFTPAYWQVLKLRSAAERTFWKNYQGSAIQALYQRLR